MPVVQDLAFWILSVVAIAAALGVVLVRDLFRSALLLAVVFISVAGFFVLLSAEFLAVVQVLIYVGAISVLFIFGIMLTRNVREGNVPNRLQIPAVMCASLLLVGMIAAAINTDWRPIPEAAAQIWWTPHRPSRLPGRRPVRPARDTPSRIRGWRNC